MASGTELACDFCAGIGPLQLGVVLVSYIYFILVQCLVNEESFAIACEAVMIGPNNGQTECFKC